MLVRIRCPDSEKSVSEWHAQQLIWRLVTSISTVGLALDVQRASEKDCIFFPPGENPKLHDDGTAKILRTNARIAEGMETASMSEAVTSKTPG